MVKVCNTTIYPEENDAKYSSYFESFPFPLSPFQKYAIEAIVEGHHVLVTAHTGSGKTLPAEFAIQHFVSSGKRLIYTSPIKALSNQKYYEFSKKYPHISFGLLTGDIKTNPEADVLIMTTEILMNSLFSKTTDTHCTQGGALQFSMNIETELGCVVFDEIHYINDSDRGQVWEKTILMLPPHIQMVMLSATIDSPEQFAQWCEHENIHGKQVYLASTMHRVVPLTHYGYVCATESTLKNIKDKVLESDMRHNTNKLITLKNDKGQYMENGYKDIKRILGVFEDRHVFLKRKAILNDLALHLRDKDMLPAIAFVFSRKHVELCAKEITVPLLEFDSKVPYTIANKCEQIVRKLPNYKEYLELPEYQSLVALLEKGVGIHHSGMIPILREIVELMISEKCIKLLFATESFAIGLDCPIKTAVFTSLTKYDGNEQRYLLSHEYTQMAGRAGRRGIDTIGHVVHCNNLFTLPTSSEYNSLLCGSPQKLVSKFKISYHIILGYLGKSEDPVSLNTFVQFVEKSMLLNEITKEKLHQSKVVANLSEQLEKKRRLVELLPTHKDVCNEYLQIEMKIKQLVNKKKKECERQLQRMKDEYKHLLDNCKIVQSYNELLAEYSKEQSSLATICEYIPSQIRNVINILMELGFIEECSQDEYIATHLGKMAAEVGEIHPILFIQLFQYSDQFATFSPKQLVSLFSCFTDIKVSPEIKLGFPNSKDPLLQKTVEKMDNLFQDLEHKECEKSMNTGISYHKCMYDLVDEIVQWCDCETEQDCKYYIQKVLGEAKSISIGDFTKAILKIATIVKEVGSLCEKYGYVELQHKLASIEPMILKYITTTQSLYV